MTNSDTSQTPDFERRRALRVSSAVWITPVVLFVSLPTHAQTSSCGFELGLGQGGAIDADGTPEAITLTCSDEFITFKNIDDVPVGGIVEGIELTNPDHILLQPTTFPIVVPDGGNMPIKIREDIGDCTGVTSLSAGTMRIFVRGCPVVEYSLSPFFAPI